MVKVTDTPAGKIGIAIVAVVAVALAIFMGVHFMSAQGPQIADDKEVKSDAQMAIDQLEKNTTMPADKKAEEIAHWQGVLQGHSKGAGGGPPTGASSTGEPRQ